MNFFPRPAKRPMGGPTTGPTGDPPRGTVPTGPRPPQQAQVQDAWECPLPQTAATVASLIGLIITAFAVSSGGPTQRPSAMASVAAIGTILSLGIGFAFDMRKGLNNLIRADILALLAFYFLTFFEFLFPQTRFDVLAAHENAAKAINLVLVGFCGLLIGRHLIHPKRPPLQRLLTHEIPPGILLLIFWGAFCIGYLHQWISPAVSFDPVKWMDFTLRPRFEQPWGRGRFGDFSAMLYELNMVINLVPPLAGIILARRHRFGRIALTLVICAFLLALFIAVAGATRSVLASYLVTFVIGFAFASSKERKRELLILGGAAVALMAFGTVAMLHIRSNGLKKFLTGEAAFSITKADTVFVDYNLCNIAGLTAVFPDRMPYLGLEVPYLALIRPIPRALWKNKPSGLSHSIEYALGSYKGDMTLSASFAGEAYISGGFLGVLICGLFFGAVNGWWSHLMGPRNSELGILIYSSGFFAAVISMRSLFSYTTALLPTVAAIVGTACLVRYLVRKARSLAFFSRSRTAPPGPAESGQPYSED